MKKEDSVNALQATLILAAALLLGGLTLNVRADEGPEQAERVAVGHKAPAVVLTGADETVYDSTQLLDKKSLVLVFFRGAW